MMNSKIYFCLFFGLFCLIIASSAEPSAASSKDIPPRVKEVCDGLIIIINTGKISVTKSLNGLKIKSDGSCQRISDGRPVPDRNVDYSNHKRSNESLVKGVNTYKLDDGKWVFSYSLAAFEKASFLECNYALIVLENKEWVVSKLGVSYEEAAARSELSPK